MSQVTNSRHVMCQEQTASGEDRSLPNEWCAESLWVSLRSAAAVCLPPPLNKYCCQIIDLSAFSTSTFWQRGCRLALLWCLWCHSESRSPDSPVVKLQFLLGCLTWYKTEPDSADIRPFKRNAIHMPTVWTWLMWTCCSVTFLPAEIRSRIREI